MSRSNRAPALPAGGSPLGVKGGASEPFDFVDGGDVEESAEGGGVFGVGWVIRPGLHGQQLGGDDGVEVEESARSTQTLRRRKAVGAPHRLFSGLRRWFGDSAQCAPGSVAPWNHPTGRRNGSRVGVPRIFSGEVG